MLNQANAELNKHKRPILDSPKNGRPISDLRVRDPEIDLTKSEIGLPFLGESKIGHIMLVRFYIGLVYHPVFVFIRHSDYWCNSDRCSITVTDL
jgi:hypothetical protein